MRTGRAFRARRGDDPVRERDRDAAAAAALGSRQLCSGLVGKRLMMHPFATIVGVFEEDFRAWQGPWGQFIHSMEF